MKEFKGAISIQKVEIISCSLKQLTIYHNPLNASLPREFKAVFTTRGNKKDITIGPVTINNIITFLQNAGYVSNSYHIKDVLSILFNEFEVNNLVEVKDIIDQPGFYFDNNLEGIYTVDYDLKDPSIAELQKALNVINESCKILQRTGRKVISYFEMGTYKPFYVCN